MEEFSNKKIINVGGEDLRTNLRQAAEGKINFGGDLNKAQDQQKNTGLDQVQ